MKRKRKARNSVAALLPWKLLPNNRTLGPGAVLCGILRHCYDCMLYWKSRARSGRGKKKESKRFEKTAFILFFVFSGILRPLRPKKKRWT